MKKVTTQGLIGLLKRNYIRIAAQKMDIKRGAKPRFIGVSVTKKGDSFKVFHFKDEEGLISAYKAMVKEGYHITLRALPDYFHVSETLTSILP